MRNLDSILQNDFNKIVFSKPLNNSKYKKIVINRLKNAKTVFQAEQYTQTQVIHSNFENLAEFVKKQTPFFKEIYFFGDESYSAFLKNGEISFSKKIEATKPAEITHNKEKNYILPEGTPIPIFVKIGIFTAEYKVVAAMRDKFKQINRYLELLRDCLNEYKEGDAIYVVDFGCGKSYLSFAVYYYLTEIKKLKVTFDCYDLKKTVIDDCSRLAEEYGYTDMNFYADDIKNFTPKRSVDLVISLHACDVATDYVLKQAVEANAKYIFSVPCCQKEVNSKISVRYNPILFRYGILKERVSALITDAVRATVLELNDYKTDILEFVDLSDSPKNLLIRAKKSSHSPSYKELKKRELKELLLETGVTPKIAELFSDKIGEI